MGYIYATPTKVFAGRLTEYAEEFTGAGKRAFIVTGKSSSANGSLDDVKNILDKQKIASHVFDTVEENPSVENVFDAVEAGRAFGADFVIGIGGGSPLDAAKAVALPFCHAVNGSLLPVSR